MKLSEFTADDAYGDKDPKQQLKQWAKGIAEFCKAQPEFFQNETEPKTWERRLKEAFKKGYPHWAGIEFKPDENGDMDCYLFLGTLYRKEPVLEDFD